MRHFQPTYQLPNQRETKISTVKSQVLIFFSLTKNRFGSGLGLSVGILVDLLRQRSYVLPTWGLSGFLVGERESTTTIIINKLPQMYALALNVRIPKQMGECQRQNDQP